MAWDNDHALPHGWRIVGLFVGAFVTMTALWAVAGVVVAEISETSIGSFDQDLSSWMEDNRSDSLTDLAILASRPADSLVKILVVLTLALAMRLAFRRWSEWTFLVTALVLEVTVYGAASRIVSRPRPNVEHLASETAQSWPSGHVAAAVTLYVGLAVITRWRSDDRRLVIGTAVAAGVIVIAMCVARLYLGAHFLTDVVGGVALGLTSLGVTNQIFRVAGQS